MGGIMVRWTDKNIYSPFTTHDNLQSKNLVKLQTYAPGAAFIRHINTLRGYRMDITGGGTRPVTILLIFSLPAHLSILFLSNSSFSSSPLSLFFAAESLA